ncbi:hypothetical protein B0A66_17945 [Flavobacterium hercynium]|uniref:Uncharacterized protein n=1 Tax=Flavobacterium hercynium TaxID=387094 RepID=A0A226GWJ7_9FLAO|nr:hypothetical protein B0A66_17945 [Flavobacterium hercynium]
MDADDADLQAKTQIKTDFNYIAFKVIKPEEKNPPKSAFSQNESVLSAYKFHNPTIHNSKLIT